MNDLKNDPTVEGAITRNGNTACDAPAPRRPASSIQQPHACFDGPPEQARKLDLIGQAMAQAIQDIELWLATSRMEGRIF